MTMCKNIVGFSKQLITASVESIIAEGWSGDCITFFLNFIIINPVSAYLSHNGTHLAKVNIHCAIQNKRDEWWTHGKITFQTIHNLLNIISIEWSIWHLKCILAGWMTFICTYLF